MQGYVVARVYFKFIQMVGGWGIGRNVCGHDLKGEGGRNGCGHDLKGGGMGVAMT